MLSPGAAALFSSNLKILPGIALTGISSASVPTSFIVYSLKNENNIFTGTGLNPIKNSLDSLSNFIHSQAEETPKKLREEYEKAIENGKQSFTQESVNAITQTWKSGKETSKGIYEYIKENAEDINYYTFTLGNLVKSTFTFLPTIIRDSIIYNENTKKEQHLLSFQKMIAVAAKSTFAQFLGSIKGLVTKHHQVLRTLTLEDGIGVLKILREVREGNYDTFMSKINENIKKAQDKTYTNATDLLKEVFIGVEDMNQLNEKIKSLKQQIDTLKTELSKIKDVGNEAIEKLKTILEELEKQTQDKKTESA